MDLRRFRVLQAAGVSTAEIARETGHTWRTVRKYLAEDGPVVPPVAPSRAGTQPRVIDAFTGVVDEWLRHDVGLKAAVIHEQLVAEHGFTANYQRVKEYVRHARPRIAVELGGGDEPLSGLHRRFEVLPGAQAQVDWGDEGAILARAGVGKVYSSYDVVVFARPVQLLHYEHGHGDVLWLATWAPSPISVAARATRSDQCSRPWGPRHGMPVRFNVSQTMLWSRLMCSPIR